MNSKPELTAKCLEKILKEKKQQLRTSTEDKPLVQVLALKPISSGSIRCVLFDGIYTTKQGVLKQSEQMDAYYQSQQLEKFSVIRLEEYWVSSMSPNDIEIIIISEITPIMRGSELNDKLDAFPPLDDALDISFQNPFTSDAGNVSTIQSTFNPNYKPRNQPNKKLDVPIDRSKLCSINDIHPFFSSFVIRVRVATKSAIKTYSRENKEGKWFSFDATDETSEIRITAFNTECEKFFDLIEKDLVYYIFKGSVRTANKRYSNLKSDYEITLSGDSVIELCEESVPLPSIQFNFLPIKELLDQNKGNAVDVIGVITSVEPLQEIVSKKDNKEYQKRDALLLDKTLHEVRLTLWGAEAANFSGTKGQILAVKNAMVGEFRGKTLGCVQNSIIELDPDLSESHLLKGWYDRESTADHLTDIVPLCKRDEKQSMQFRYLCQVNQESIPDRSVLYYNCKATILSMNRTDKHLYKSCAKKPCMKKVKEDNGFYFCDKCGHNSTEFEWRLMLSLCCTDSTGDTWITVFHDVAEKLVGKSIDELSEMFDSDPSEYNSFVSGLHFKTFIFRVGSKVDEYNNEKRIKSTCYGFTPIDPIDRSKSLIQTIKSWPK